MHAQKDVNVTPPNKKRKKEKSDEEEKNKAMEEDITEDITNQIKKCVINDKEVETKKEFLMFKKDSDIRYHALLKEKNNIAEEMVKQQKEKELVVAKLESE